MLCTWAATVCSLGREMHLMIKIALTDKLNCQSIQLNQCSSTAEFLRSHSNEDRSVQNTLVKAGMPSKWCSWQEICGWLITKRKKLQNLRIFHWAGNIELTKVTWVTLLLSGLSFLSLSCHPKQKVVKCSHEHSLKIDCS